MTQGVPQPSTPSFAHHAVRVLSQPLEREERVVGLDHHVAHLILVGKHRVGLHQLLGVPEGGKNRMSVQQTNATTGSQGSRWGPETQRRET